MILANLRKLWHDDAGSVIAAEYLALAGIVAMGGVTGLQAVRDATVAEAQDLAGGIRGISQSYHQTPTKTGGASTGGVNVVNPRPADCAQAVP